MRELVFEVLAEQLLGGDLVVQRGLDVAADGGDERGTETDGLVVLGDGVFDPVDRGVRCVAQVVLDPSAEEVSVVGVAVPAGGAHEDHAPVDVLFEAALSAPDGALEVVVVALAAFAGVAALVHELLHLVEQILFDERFVSTGVGLALVADFSEVVAVAEHLLDLGVRDRPGGTSLGGAGAKPPVGELFGDVLERLVACGVQLEGEFHERRAFGIDLDGVDLPAVDVLGDVEVPDGCAAEGAAVLGLLAHLVGDVGTVFTGAVFVERGEDAVHELPDRGGVYLLGRGDQGDSAFVQIGHDDRVVGAVAGEAGELVDDDVVDVAVAADAFEHLLERDALGHLGGRPAGFDVLVHDREPEGFSLALTRRALRRDGDALGIVVGVHLPLGRDAQVDHGPAARWRVDSARRHGRDGAAPGWGVVLGVDGCERGWHPVEGERGGIEIRQAHGCPPSGESSSQTRAPCRGVRER
ncbi:hypothetical protein OH817_03915 [Kocuria rhizophila]|nr:hypothetical protein OH817_03915 [Kocuria rhizophila]